MTKPDHLHWYVCKKCGGASGGIMHFEGLHLFVRDTTPSFENVACPHCDSVGQVRVSTCEESQPTFLLEGTR